MTLFGPDDLPEIPIGVATAVVGCILTYIFHLLVIFVRAPRLIAEEAEGYYRNETALLDSEVRTLQQKVSALEADIPVVLLECPSGYLSPQAEPTLRTTKGSVLNVQIRDISIPKEGCKLMFEKVLEVNETAVSIDVYLYSETSSSAEKVRSIEAAIKALIEDKDDFDFVELMAIIDYDVPGFDTKVMTELGLKFTRIGSSLKADVEWQQTKPLVWLEEFVQPAQQPPPDQKA